MKEQQDLESKVLKMFYICIVGIIFFSQFYSYLMKKN